ncbi:hypothetical protein ACH5RR_033186 [Cinchona calisaya]|uniref:Uncharacterized protein n=1 Tax=Cinchona calisaya TaxID=153742 RepID=A0ABD2YPD1_9GENT
MSMVPHHSTSPRAISDAFSSHSFEYTELVADFVEGRDGLGRLIWWKEGRAVEVEIEREVIDEGWEGSCRLVMGMAMSSGAGNGAGEAGKSYRQ